MREGLGIHHISSLHSHTRLPCFVGIREKETENHQVQHRAAIKTWRPEGDEVFEDIRFV